MLEVYRDDQYQVAPKTIGICLYRWFFSSDHDKRTVTKKNFISSPLCEIDITKHHDATLDIEPSQLRNKHDSNTTHVSPNDLEVVREENYNEGIAISVNSKPQEPDIQELADKDYKPVASYDASMDHPVKWDRKKGLDPKITIVCPTPWTTIDPYDVHIMKIKDEDHKIACSLRSFSQKHSGYFAKFTIFTMPTITGKSESWMAGWARSGLSLHFGLIVAHRLEILSWPLQRFILSKTSTALELYDQNNFPIPESPQVLCKCFQIWREEPLKFSLKFGMPSLDLEGHTTANRQSTQAFLKYLREIFKKSASADGKAMNSLNECQDNTMWAMDRKRVDNELGRIFAHRDCLLPQEKLNTMAEHSRPE
jgi:hypothetical protein